MSFVLLRGWLNSDQKRVVLLGGCVATLVLYCLVMSFGLRDV